MNKLIQEIDFQTEIKVKATLLANQIALFKFHQSKNLANDSAFVLQTEIEAMQAMIEVYSSVIE